MSQLLIFTPLLVQRLVYMLQDSGYHSRRYLAWFWTSPNLIDVMKRGRLDPTPKARALLVAGWLIWVALLLAGASLIYNGGYGLWLGLGLIVGLPVWVSHGLLVPLKLGERLIQRGQSGRVLNQAAATFAAHPGVKIAVAGSYGKTTMKELLASVIAQEKSVAVSPGNLNTPLGLAAFARELNLTEAVVITEFGESHVGDLAELSGLVKPNYGIITGINSAHLETFGSIEAIKSTFAELVDYLGPDHVLINGQSEHAGSKPFKALARYTEDGVNGWRVEDLKISVEGTFFKLKKGRRMIKVDSPLLGRHQVGPLAAVADVADALGISQLGIERGLAAAKPFEHRFEPKKMGGALVIDDTYNGNIDGVRAGVSFVREVKNDFKRSWYITPGLVEVGSKKPSLHREIGKLAAGVFDVVVLMKNSNLTFIKQGLKKAKFKGELIEVDDPLAYYQQLESKLAAGDLVLMQNDFTDTYA